MLTITTCHTACVREGLPSKTARRALNVEYLLRLLQYSDVDTLNDAGMGTRKKRAASSEPAPARRSRKRFKKAEDTVPEKDGQGEEDQAEEESAAFPVYCHTFDMRYTRAGDGPSVVCEEEAAALGWEATENELMQLLETRRHQSQPPSPGNGWSVEIPGITIERPVSGLVAYVDGEYIMHLPAVDPGFSIEDHDMRHRHLQDSLVACQVLQDAGRAELTAQLRISTLPATNDDSLPLRITLSVTVSLIRPALFEPILYTTKTATSEVEEAQRRVLNLTFPTIPRKPPLDAGIDVPTLYAAIGPAPSLDLSSLEAAYQPAALIPTLLPFQRRTAAWLLSREHKTLDANGQVVDRQVPAAELPLFWRTVSVSPVDGKEETWFINEVTGEASATKPVAVDPPGGMLAEEPGLGKTLESIALVLLNPAVGRDPTQKAWNPDARIFTKKIKTTLIVTPISLAQQWADELKLHAPGLKVLLYEGWQKLKVPITEDDLATARENRAKTSKKAKARAGRAALAAAKAPSPALVAAREQKSVKGKGKGKAKAEPEPELETMDIDTDEEPEEELVDWCAYVNQFDVCITTYNVLQHDLGIARPPPDRPRRTIATYLNLERSRSPLVMCEWYRVIMDEVQMVGGGKTEEMVSLIPRVSSFAVSGTPARSQVADLIHVLNFLRVGAVTNIPRTWNRLLAPGYAQNLVELFSHYAVRTMKTLVRDELTIPKQTRYLVPIELGRIERHVYDQNFEKALLELGFDARGVAVADNWQVDVGTLRGWLRKLRGICTHPQVGQLQNVADKLHKPGVLKTIGEVLDSMKDQNWRNLMEDRRSKAQILTMIAQLYQHYQQHHTRYQSALDTLLKAEKETNDLIADVQAAIDHHDEEGKRLKAEAADLSGSSEKDAAEASTATKGKGKARADGTPNPDDEDDLPRNAAGEEHRTKKRGFQQRLRECQITLHKVYFLKGDVYHVLGNTEEETVSYEKAEQLRRVLLRGTEEAAHRAMAQLAGEMGEKSLSEKELMIEVPYVGVGGIRSSALMEEVNEIIDEVLNRQSALLWKWRSHLVQLLTAPLTSGGEDADGQEYARSLETQGEAESYLQAYTALLADRREVMTAERTLLAIVDVKEKKTRATKAAAKAAQALLDDDVMVALAEVEAQPEDEVLKQTLHEERKALLEDHNLERAVRSIMVELNNIAAGITRENDPEKIIAYEAGQQLRKLIADQAKLMEQLQADLSLLRKAFNERIQYFRQLQELSDTVAEAAWDGSIVDAIEQNGAQAEELEAKIKTGRARQRYLENLAKSQHDGTLDEDDESCVLCKCDFEKGYITDCAHVFCEECMRTWLLRKDGKTCPVCRVAINPGQLQRFKIGQKAADTSDAPARVVNNEPAPKSKRRIEYNVISLGVFKSIESMECNGSYGSKIQTLIRHLLYLQIIEPGAKSIVFSAWADSLFIIEHALNRNSIPYVRIDQGRGKENAVKKFKSDPSIQVLLLHGERENAGLNVTCASRVFLVESVVHHAFEIQAIARIDRMGQSRPTEVFCYYAEDTVERNILDLAARRGQSLYTKENAAGTLTAGPITAVGKKSIDAPKRKAQKGDFVFKTDDMLAIFFPHLFEEIEYLVEDDVHDSMPVHHANAQPVAGPSRLA